MKSRAEKSLDLSDFILIEMHKKGVDPTLSYAALEAAFLGLHKALGKGKLTV